MSKQIQQGPESIYDFTVKVCFFLVSKIDYFIWCGFELFSCFPFVCSSIWGPLSRSWMPFDMDDGFTPIREVGFFSFCDWLKKGFLGTSFFSLAMRNVLQFFLLQCLIYLFPLAFKENSCRFMFHAVYVTLQEYSSWIFLFGITCIDLFSIVFSFACRMLRERVWIWAFTRGKSYWLSMLPPNGIPHLFLLHHCSSSVTILFRIEIYFKVRLGVILESESISSIINTWMIKIFRY